MEARSIVGDCGEKQSSRSEMTAQLLALYIKLVMPLVYSLDHTYCLRTNDLQLLGERVQSLSRSSNSGDRLLCNFVRNMLTHNLESGHRAEQVPGLDHILVSLD